MLTPAADVTSRAMRSSINCDYFVRRTTLGLGDRAFSDSVAASPRAWNRLPSELKTTTTCSIETFKKRLETYFYLILLLLLIRRDNVMRHRSVCRGAQQVPVVIIVVVMFGHKLLISILLFLLCTLYTIS